MNHDLSIIIIAKNEERVIRKTLESISGWAGEIIVLDSGSTDDTVEICRRYTDKVYITDWPGYGKQKNRALDKATKKWVLSLDADESVTEQLKIEIDKVLSIDLPYAGYKIPVRLLYFGEYIRSLLKKHPLILFQREFARFTDTDVHEHIVLSKGKVAKLRGYIQHDSYEDYYHQNIKLTKYAHMWALSAYSEGRRSGIGKAFVHGMWMFIRGVLLERAFMDGWRGILLAIVHGQYTFNKYVILKTLEK